MSKHHSETRIILSLLLALALVLTAAGCSLVSQVQERLGLGENDPDDPTGEDWSQVVILPDETTDWVPQPGTTVFVGVTGSARREVWAPVTALAAEEGINIAFQTYQDAKAANNALLNGDIDLNFVQTYADFTYSERIYEGRLGVVGYAVTASMGVYGNYRATHPNSILNGSTITVPENQPQLNQAMRCLEEWGAVSIDPGASYQATPADVIRNMRNVEIRTAPYASVPGYFGRTSYVVMDTWQTLDAGYNPAAAVYTNKPVDGRRSQYTEVILSVFEERNNPLYEYVVSLFHSDETRAYLLENYGEAVLGAWPLPSPTPTPIGYVTTTTMDPDIVDRYVTPIPGQTNSPIWGN